MSDEKVSVSNEGTIAKFSLNDEAKNVLHYDGETNNKDNGSKTRHCNSLPLFQNSELCELGSRPGMECMPLRAPPGPYHHYHVTDQTKSLQELQNEVGALLEFRDLVIETFPDLKHKMASMSTTNTLTGMASSSLASRREWEPGIRVKRKITQKENAEMSSSSLIRSRSNSHSGKKEPKSGEGNGSVVQDSGFSTETSSSKEAHSASSTTGAMQGAVATNRLLIDANDELLNLLDVIHRKSNRLRDEVEHLQNLERSKLRSNVNNSSETSCLNKTFQDHVDRLNKEDIQILRKERDRLLDKLAEMEAETLAGRIKATKMQDQFEELCSVKKELEEQLKLALSQKLELNSRLHELHKQYASKSSSSSQSDSTSHRNSSTTTVVLAGVSIHQQHQQQQQNLQLGASTGRLIASSASTFTPVVVDQMKNLDDNKNFYPFHSSDIKQISNDLKNLGRLDGLVSSPNRVSKVRMTDSKKIAAILLETNVLELQRHLLTLTVQNQVLTQRLEQATKAKIVVMKNMDKSKDVIEDLRFQLEEKNIELEGTKAQLRVLESKSQIPTKLDLSTETNRSSSTIILSSRDSPITSTQISTPSMKAMIPLPMDEIQQHSSSTESAQDHTERESRLVIGGIETPKKRPSKIPLLGSKGYLAPKPPTGRNNQKSPLPGSNKSLSRSTGSLYGKSGPPSIRRESTQSSSLNRPESAQSLRKDSSLGTNSRSSSSSIPISSKSTPSPHKISSSPLPKPKRDSLTSRVRHLDSLSRVYNSPTSPTYGNSNSSNNSSTSTSNYSNQLVTGSTTNLQRLTSSSKKDLSSSFTQGQSRDRNKSTVSVRRVSSASVGRNATVELQQNETDNGKILKLRKMESMDSFKAAVMISNKRTPNVAKSDQTKPTKIPSRNLISEYIAKTCLPPAILRPLNPTYELPSPDAQMELAYKHPLLLFDIDIDEEKDESKEDTSYQTNREIEVKYINNSVAGGHRHQWCFDSGRSNQCKLLGKLNTRIGKEINSSTATSGRDGGGSGRHILSRSVSNNSYESEKILFYQPVLENEANFHVNKITYSDEDEEEEQEDEEELEGEDESSYNFYDSIDDRRDDKSNNNTNNNRNHKNCDNIVSICHQEAGEEMAEINSYERRKYCWSLDSGFK